jgi:hypothetical protein
MRKILLVALLLALLPGAAQAQLTSVGVVNGVPNSGTGTVSTLDGLVGTAGTANTKVQTVQGIASMVPFLVSQNGTWSMNQAGTWTVQPGNTANTTPWLFTISQGGNSAAVKAGNTAATTDQAVVVSDPNLLAAAQAGTATNGATYPGSSIGIAGRAKSAAPTAASDGQIQPLWVDLTGKAVTSPYAARELMVRGAASTTGTGATTLIAAGGASIKTYITDIECGRTDAGTSAITVTFNDSASTVLVLPNSGGGGGNVKAFNVPLVTAANTAFTFTAGTGVTTLYCAAQGFSGY